MPVLSNEIVSIIFPVVNMPKPTLIPDWQIRKSTDIRQSCLGLIAGAPQTRRSIFGYFARRCQISYHKLSVEGMNALFDDYQKWIKDEFDEESVYIKKDVLSNGELYAQPVVLSVLHFPY